MRNARIKNYTLTPVFCPMSQKSQSTKKRDRPKRYRKRSAKEFRCLECLRAFVATRYDAKFCSSRCRKRAQRGSPFILPKKPPKRQATRKKS